MFDFPEIDGDVRAMFVPSSGSAGWTRKRRCGFDDLSWSVIFLFLLVICSQFSQGKASRSDNNGCAAVKRIWKAKGFGTTHQVPSSAFQADHSSVCGHGSLTCCTRQMESKLTSHSRQHFYTMLSERLNGVRSDFQTRTATFEDFCTDLVDKSGRELHNMFTRTYGIIYQQNSHVFTELFRDLRAYFRGADHDLSDVLDAFFSSLLLRMFTLLNGQYVFDERYLGCISERSQELAPFGDSPHKLGIQVKRAFVAARTFRHGLVVGSDIITSLSKMELSSSCQKAITRMLYCPYCRGQASGVKSCSGLCLNVVHGCLAQHPEFSTAWNGYIESMLKVADRLDGPFSIENVLDPMDVKISEAIMNFQENAETVTSKVFHVCGQPNLGVRSKRNAVDTTTSAAAKKRKGGRTTLTPTGFGQASDVVTPRARRPAHHRSTIAPSNVYVVGGASVTTDTVFDMTDSTQSNETVASFSEDFLGVDSALSGRQSFSSSTSVAAGRLDRGRSLASTGADTTTMTSPTTTTTMSTVASTTTPTTTTTATTLPTTTSTVATTRPTTTTTTTTTPSTTTVVVYTRSRSGPTAAGPRRAVRTSTTTTTTTRPPPVVGRRKGGGSRGSSGRTPGGGGGLGSERDALRSPSMSSSFLDSGPSSSSSTSNTPFEQMMSEIRLSLTASQGFLSAVPERLCSGLSAPLSEETRCWNGTSRSRYTATVVDGTAESQLNNREVQHDTRRSGSTSAIGQAVLQLRQVTEKLKRAYNGDNVDWSDDDGGSDDEYAGNNDDEEEDDEDLESSGSGLGEETDVRSQGRKRFEDSSSIQSPYQPRPYHGGARGGIDERVREPYDHRRHGFVSYDMPTTRRLPPVYVVPTTSPKRFVYINTPKPRVTQRPYHPNSASQLGPSTLSFFVSIFGFVNVMIRFHSTATNWL